MSEKNPLKILTESTGISFGLLFLVGGLIVGAIGWAWQQSVAMGEIRYELKELRLMIQTQWTRQDHEIWAMQLALKNPEMEVPLDNSNSAKTYRVKPKTITP